MIIPLFALFSLAQPRSVCEVLDAAARLNGSVTTVRGLIDGSPFHGFVLLQTRGLEPCPGWRRQVLTAPPALLLVWDGGFGVQLSNSEKAANAFELAACISRYRMRQTEPLPAEVRGVVVAKKFPLIFRRPDGSYWGNALGDGGQYAAILVIQSISVPALAPYRGRVKQ